MKILIALDASKHSERALDLVTRMRWPAGSRVLVATAMQPWMVGLGPTLEPGGGAVWAPIETREDLKVLVARGEERLREAGIPTESRVLEGDPRDALIELARSERADLIVVGSHGHTGVAKLVLGSVSSHIVTHAPCSVLVVKQQGQTPHVETESAK